MTHPENRIMDSASAIAEIAYDSRWHQDMDKMVSDHDRTLRGNGTPGLKERVNKIEQYVSERIDRDNEEVRVKRANRFQYVLAAWAGGLALAGLLAMSVLDHTILRPQNQAAPQSTTTTTSTDSNSTTTTKK